jgi:hypothetical protein
MGSISARCMHDDDINMTEHGANIFKRARICFDAMILGPGCLCRKSGAKLSRGPSRKSCAFNVVAISLPTIHSASVKHVKASMTSVAPHVTLSINEEGRVPITKLIRLLHISRGRVLECSGTFIDGLVVRICMLSRI